MLPGRDLIAGRPGTLLPMSSSSRSGHYFDPSPEVRSRPGEVTLALPDATVSLAVDRGVFSAGRVDPGTMALLKAVSQPPASGHLLDLGCGYGPIAVTLARRAKAATVWAVDINARAVGLTRDNAARLGLGNVRASTPDEVPPKIRFATIWTNPPIRIGNEALHELLGSWLPRLAPDGTAWLVVQRHLGADSLAAWLGEQGWAVRRHASKQGYRILQVTPEADRPETSGEAS
jgi:16S rRNA (guanine1207-N2)-methyltransferase